MTGVATSVGGLLFFGRPVGLVLELALLEEEALELARTESAFADLTGGVLLGRTCSVGILSRGAGRADREGGGGVAERRERRLESEGCEAEREAPLGGERLGGCPRALGDCPDLDDAGGIFATDLVTSRMDAHVATSGVVWTGPQPTSGVEGVVWTDLVATRPARNAIPKVFLSLKNFTVTVALPSPKLPKPIERTVSTRPTPADLFIS